MATGYRQIARDLRSEIETRDLQPGTRLPTQDRLMARFGVSAKTVKAAIRELAHQGVVYSRRGKGMFVAERGGPTTSVLFLMPHLNASDVFQEIYAACERAFVGVRRAVYASTEHSYAHTVKQIEHIPAGMYEAVVFVPFEGPEAVFNGRVVDALEQKTQRVVLLDRAVPGAKRPLITFNNRAAGKKLGTLIQRGDYDSYIFAYHAESETVEARWTGFRSSFPSTMVNAGRVEKWSVEQGLPDKAAMLAELARTRGPVGLFAVNEHLAHKLYVRLLESGCNAPSDVGMVTFGNSLQLGTHITAARPDVDAVPAALLRLMDGGSARSVVIPVDVIQGDTVRASNDGSRDRRATR
jgi:DNA-binding LacI/PurR family transcriptional regulator